MTTYAELLIRALPMGTAQQGLARVALALVLALGVLAAHFMLGAAFGIYGFGWIALVAAASFALSWELACALVIACLLLQNAFIAAVLPLLGNPDNFSILLGTDFAIPVLLALFYGPVWLKLRRNLPAESQALLLWLIIFFIVVVAYTGLGALSVSLTSTLVYARVYFTGGLMLILGVVFGLRLPFGFIFNLARIVTVLLTGWAVVEYFFAYGLYDLFHVMQFFNLKLSSFSDTFTYASVAELISNQTSSYLNLSGQFGLNIELLRLMGPNLHPISYAYALAFCALTSFIGRRSVLTGLCLMLEVLIGAKGPLVMTLLALALSLFYARTRNRRWLLAVLVGSLTLFVIVGLIYGIRSEDYHVVGLLGGLNGFLHNPLGHGIGVGGNMSTLGMTEANFSLFQGYGADFALESGFGVMLYQIGIGAVAFYIFYWKLWKSVWKATVFFAAEPRLVVIPIVLAFLVANSVFQEEVFSPTAWGLWLLLSGLLLARHWKISDSVHA